MSETAPTAVKKSQVLEAAENYYRKFEISRSLGLASSYGLDAEQRIERGARLIMANDETDFARAAYASLMRQWVDAGSPE